MKKREQKDVKTSTLVILLIVFAIVWYFVITIAYKLPVLPMRDEILKSIIAFFMSVVLSGISVSVLAILRNWKI